MASFQVRSGNKLNCIQRGGEDLAIIHILQNTYSHPNPMVMLAIDFVFSKTECIHWANK